MRTGDADWYVMRSWCKTLTMPYTSYLPVKPAGMRSSDMFTLHATMDLLVLVDEEATSIMFANMAATETPFSGQRQPF